MAGRISLIKMIVMPQVLHVLHSTPMVIPLKMFCIINSMFRSYIWLDRPPRIKVEQLQKPKEAEGIALPNQWLYYLAAQLQHITRAMLVSSTDVGGEVNSTVALMCLAARVDEVAIGLEALVFAKSNKQFPMYVLMQKVWNKTRQIQDVTGFTSYSPIWDNGHY